MVWASASTWSTPGITGRPRTWPWKNHSVAVTALRPTIRFASGSYSTIRSTSRNGQRCGMRPSISRTECTAPGVADALSAADGGLASVTGGSRKGRGKCAVPRAGTGRRSLQGCSGEASCALRPGEEGGAADPVQQVGGEPAVQERLRDQQRLVDLGVGDHALDDELAQRGAPAGDARLA